MQLSHFIRTAGNVLVHVTQLLFELVHSEYNTLNTLIQLLSLCVCVCVLCVCVCVDVCGVCVCVCVCVCVFCVCGIG